jgi:acyl-CoA oxidase
VRYAAVRRQTAARAGEREVQVLDYQNTAADLLPLVAACYALIFMARARPGRARPLPALLSPAPHLGQALPDGSADI